MKIATTADRLTQILRERRMRQVDILEAAKPYCERYNVKLNKNDLSQYVHGKTEPGQVKLSILGLALDVSEAWLLGYDVPMERTAPAESEPSSQPLSDVDAYALRLYSTLSPEQKHRILGEILKGIEADAKRRLAYAYEQDPVRRR